jgi:TolB-like protein
VFQAAAADRLRRRAALKGRPSIVVLSFAGKAAEPAQRDLGDGLADDVATELGRFRELDVIAPTTALAYRHAAVAPERVGAEFGTAYVLEGRLRAVDEELRITVRLIETATARQLWAERYEGGRADAWDIRDEVVRRLVGTLVGHVEDARLEAATRRRPDDLAAYDLWLRGWRALQRPDLAAIGEARRWFQRAVAADPGFARAYVGLALTHLNEWACFTWNHWVFPKDEVLALARRAVELDDHDQRAHCILGMTELYARDYEAARPRLLKALELNPNDADVLAHVSVGMALIGEQNLAVEVGRRALRLAPHGPEWHAAFVGEALFAARLHDEAIAAMAPAPEALCNTPAFLAASHAHLGQVERCAGHRETVCRHHRRQQARGLFPEGMGRVDWLLAMDPFRRVEDVDHYVEGLRKAGFE